MQNEWLLKHEGQNTGVWSVYLEQLQRTSQHLCDRGKRAEREPWSSRARRSQPSLCHRSRRHRHGRRLLLDSLMLCWPCWRLTKNKHGWTWTFQKVLILNIKRCDEYYNILLQYTCHEIDTLLAAYSKLTLCQGDGDDDTIPGADPQTFTRNHQSCDPHKGETQFARTCRTAKYTLKNSKRKLGQASAGLKVGSCKMAWPNILLT